VTPATKARVMNQISKHQAYRRNIKARAIGMKGGQCERCGFQTSERCAFITSSPCGED
jgi:hypothetical protein